MKVKVLKFKKFGYINLENSSDMVCNVIQCGKNRFTLKEFRLQEGHDDSLPYTSLLCLNGKPVCRCTNDGWGGQTEMTPVDIQAKAIMASIIANVYNYGWEYKGTKFNLDLNFIANTLADGEYILGKK